MKFSGGKKYVLKKKGVHEITLATNSPTIFFNPSSKFFNPSSSFFNRLVQNVRCTCIET